MHATLDCMVHRPAVIAIAVLARHLCPVHGNVAVLQQGGGIGRIVREQGHADRGTQEQFPALHHQRLAQLPHQHFSQQPRVCGHITIAHRDHELISAEARQQGFIAPGFGDRAIDTLCKLQQCFIASFVAKGVIDSLEVVDIGEQQAQPVIGGTGSHQPMIKRLAECQPVGQPGQRVGIGHAPHFAVMAGDRITHAGKTAHQFTHLVVAGVLGQRRLVVARLDATGSDGEITDRRNQSTLHVQDHDHADHHQ